MMCVKKTKKLDGNIAEVGVYQGASAKLICETKGDRALFLFDTFSGLPEVNKIDKTLFFKGEYSYTKEKVEEYLKKYKNIYIYEGHVPETSTPVLNKKFSFVHLDVDTYKSILACLQFFYSRMKKGGIILSHDYANVIGVRRAFETFYKYKNEIILEVGDTQCLVVKL